MLAPLLYAIAANGLTWLVCDKKEKQVIKGIQIDEQTQMCLELFADDTDALVANEESNLKEFWDCLDI